MKRFLTLVAAALMAVSVSGGGIVTNTVKWNVPWGDRYRERNIETLDAYETGINLLASGGTIISPTISGKATLNGELEVNGSDVDINMTLTSNEVDITQTNEAGTANVPLIKINDARTGLTANTAGEATLVIDAKGTHSICATQGIVKVGAEIESDEDITLDPAGNDLIVDATVDATAYTADAAAGIDTKTAGALKVGVTTANQIDYGSSAVTQHIFAASAGASNSVVLPALAINDAEINDVGAAKITGDIAVARLTSAAAGGGLTLVASNITGGTFPAISGVNLTALNGGNVTGLPAANIASGGTLPSLVGTALTALNGGNVTGLPPANIASGTLPALNGEALTSLNGGAITGVPLASLVSAVQTSLGKADTALQPGTITITPTTNSVSKAYLYITNTLSSATTMVGWWSITAAGAATTSTNFLSITNFAGTTQLTATNSPTVVFTCGADGSANLAVDVNGAATNYFNVVQRDGAIKSSPEVVLVGP